MAQVDFIGSQRELTVQEQTRQDREIGFGLLFWLAKAGEIISPWWSKERDRQLRNFSKESDHFNGAVWMMATKLASVPFRIESRDSSVKSHVKLASQYQTLTTNMFQFGQGWFDFWSRFLYDLWTVDNGAFGEVIGEGDPNGPLEGPALSLAHLDSLKCTRSSNPEWPVIYQDTDGRRYRFHHTRVIYTSQLPSPAAEMYGVGLSWLSRCINSIQRLIDIATYSQEKLGSRPIRQLVLGKGISTETIMNAVAMSGEGMDNESLSRFAKSVVIGDDAKTDWDITTLDFASIPDGFDEQTTTELAMFVIALAGGFPPRWLWPATTTGATKADAMYSHIAGTGGGASWHLNMMRDLLSYSARVGEIGPLLPPKFLPKELKLTFDYQDDEQDRLQSDIRSARAKTRDTDLKSGVVDVRTSREQALSDGDITQAQFNRMELNDGRLPNGDDVLTLFSSPDEFFIQALGDIDITSVEQRIAEMQVVLATAPNAKQRDKARQALAALRALQEPDQQSELEEDEEEKSLTGPFESKSVGDFRANLRQSVRGLWNGAFGISEFVAAMVSAIEVGFRQAFVEGIAECGFKPDEMSDPQKAVLQGMINEQFPFLFNFGVDVEENSRANDGKLSPHYSRLGTWVNNYPRVRDRAAAMACADKKKKFKLGQTEDHCRSCAGFDERVYRYSTWAENDALPRSRALACHGYRCECEVVDTTDRITPGPFPSGLLGE